ncbi:hydrogenase nickel incorporation protein HypB [Clostridium tagluense]|uniref:hydrogenase nickel incorporation protein HypB n=1 Tax=Clostridium tagluense TaxID=360422 RepID=UPI001C0DEDB4|nr:hydrogenase nickel incorporation protein HypB [Clostridium tagluense]MBU3128798.1 hydrogenase nickel incorporation protein HypB [Clostridium tagluense]MBW9157163.1 hydrogenase nickel incorporation protein HypB [Clostridium tagluense]MCB2313048.1 hydrogenase nickel incorporation protein HypB [Clostridium tagluense]MCB2317843.1 hydrogenase nickel incorporation protein HypB [Clostridium tagluense]MCB2322628.1 hydrogenase nickel incorporation protein HypB [Clostridium tagluense]
MSEIKININMLNTNEEIHAENKNLFDEEGIFVINLMSAPGSGKTSILEKLIPRLKDRLNIAVIEGDLYTTKDAERIEATGVTVVQINTAGPCYLDGGMVREASLNFDLRAINLIIIENVGSISSPAEFEIGEDIKICVLSVTEGNDKPLKYPLMFEKSTAIVLNKIDLMKYTDFNEVEFYKDIKLINDKAKIFETSCIKNRGIDELSDWILQEVNKKLSII